MGKIIDKTITKIVTEEGITHFRRVTKESMQKGKYRKTIDKIESDQTYQTL